MSEATLKFVLTYCNDQGMSGSVLHGAQWEVYVTAEEGTDVNSRAFSLIQTATDDTVYTIDSLASGTHFNSTGTSKYGPYPQIQDTTSGLIYAVFGFGESAGGNVPVRCLVYASSNPDNVDAVSGYYNFMYWHNHQIHTFTTDWLGRLEAGYEVEFTIDDSDPATYPTITPTIPDGVSLMYNSTPLVDGSAVTFDSDGTLTATADSVKIDVLGNDISTTINGDTATSYSATPGETVEVIATPALTFDCDVPEGCTLFVNSVEAKDGETITVSESGDLGVVAPEDEGVDITFELTSMSSATIDGKTVENGTAYNLKNNTSHSVTGVGATAIPPVTVGGAGITGFSVNGVGYATENLPYTFTPTAGVTNQIYMDGENTEIYTLRVDGTDLQTVNINGEPVSLPYSATVDKDMTVTASGEIYQLDLSGTPGAIVVNAKTGEIYGDGATKMHRVVDIDADTYLAIDGTHVLTVTGDDIQYITINGVRYPVESLPVQLNNTQMTATVNITGYPPSEVHVVGNYIDTITVDGDAVAVGESGAVDLEITTRDENHYINIVGSQPREYAITYNDNDSTTVKQDGKDVGNSVQYISKDIYVSATPEPVPIHVETSPTVTVQVNGKAQSGNDFTFDVNSATELDITAETTELTIDYGDNSYTLTVPQQVITITAPHRDGWIFDTWSSSNVGIMSPKQVRTQIDLRGKLSANVVCHYQRCYTMDKPNPWN